MNTCQCCGKEYSRSEVIRKHGDYWWSPIFCSPECLKKKYKNLTPPEMKGESENDC